MTPRPGAVPRDAHGAYELGTELGAYIVACADRATRLDELARELRAAGESGAAAAAIRCAERARRESTFLQELASELDAVIRRH